MRGIVVALAACLILTPAGVSAEQANQLELFGKGDFKGPSMSLAGPTQHIDPAFTVRSVRISGRGSWELCSGNTYTGCRRVDRSLAGAVFIVRSARPVAPIIVTRVSPENKSLRGVASEFFVAPNRGGQQVSVPGGNGELMGRSADEFCRSAGWQQSAHAQIQQEGDHFYLVDVLCTNRP